MNVVALILLAGEVVLLVYLWRRRTTKAEAEKSIATVFAITPAENAKPPPPEKRTGRARRRRFLSGVHDRRLGPPRRCCDQPQEAMGASFTEEMDPFAESGALLAHGHDADAEHILKDAIAKDPARHELKIKLLAIYLQRQDRVAFSVLAEELYAALGL